MIKSILVVCVGNICRSPMTVGLLQQAMPELTMFSAGLGALVGNPADSMAVQLLSELGADISGHRAQQMNSELAGRADLILVMDNDQRGEVQLLYPQASGKVFRLGELVKMDIPDPYGEPRRAFEHALHLIREGIDTWVPRIRGLR
ncbi:MULTISPECIES: low molecular weight protein-tyrosine-phosphatase [Burkholderia]|uniref:protein-tyrosine-phosphatase n=1 Tax=Burkholderia humptydooensis TaxID=430531 RepID=A0A7U4SS93_9BURK|nr:MULTISPECIES: low molecular weight protein-tyrosine-phosphatase [Burkholderia]AGK48924.1 low molecular weight protein-tyrosine-phosphatase ptp [Burkholderia thailandensis MSMB121]ATF36924.1 low molecular weight phosphotyrosine protein phosphatase [Burkholderia thailandensis]AJY43303.1 low molecular weight phosphotyrosine phosphatase family protein [Burkholderia sp. 2002721687]ALX42593.1 protein tyrosine phosphatase [Burkholderia humptydooensis]KST74299.1 protein tyrosine phosphatase [Burkho